MIVRNIAVVLSADNRALRSALVMGARDVETFDNRVSKSAGGLDRFTKLAATAAKGGAMVLAAALFVATAAAVGFETRMRNVNSISHLSERAFAAQNREVLAMSKTFPQSANVLAEGLYDIASSGFQGAEGMTVLAASAKAASAGLSDTATSAKAITAVLNAYGLEASEAERVGNVLFEGVNVGVMSFEELASSIGNVVGTAAAASVPIEDLTAGIATMTLSGISAAEASTAMNRTLQALIDPSDALATTISALGYESGASMLAQEGLHGTMEKLRMVTGGNIEVLLRYFPEIRAARGALALMSAEGENYNKVQEAMNKAQENGGAMQRTFAEQMKSTSAQLTLVKNNVTAFGIEMGTKFLPYVKDGLKELREFTSGVIDLAREGKERLEPFLSNLRPIFDNITTALGYAAKAAAPFVAGLAALAALGVIEALNLLSSGIVSLTGFLADHEDIVVALTAAYGVRLLASLYAASGGFSALAVAAYNATGAMAGSSVVTALKSVQAAVYGIAAAFGTQGVAGAASAAATQIGAMVSVTGLLAIAAAGVAFSYMQIQQANERLSTAGRTWAEDYKNSLDLSKATYAEVIQRYHETGAIVEELGKQMKALDEDRSAADKAVGSLGYNEKKAMEEASKRLSELQDDYGGFIKVVQEVARETGMSHTEASQAIVDQGYKVDDLSEKTKEGELAQQDAINGTIRAWEKKVDATVYGLSAVGATQDEISRLAGLTGEEFEAEAARIQKIAGEADEFSKKVGQAWASQQDVVAALGEEVGVTGKQILGWYDVMVADGQKFSENIRKAVEMGYDPGLIARTIEAGPAQAGPLLQAMVDNQSQHFVDRINSAEQALEELNQKAVELARLTHRAMTAETDIMARDLNKAMQLSTIIMASGGHTTMKALADQLHIGADEVKRIADEYGISLAAALDPVRSATGLPPIPRVSAQRGRAFAEGGYIDPAVWGDTNRDSVPAYLMPGEVVIKKEAVKRAGLADLLHLNKTGQFPGYATGGLVAGLAGAARGGIGGIGSPSVVDGYAPASFGDLPLFPNYPPGTMGDTSEQASAQTYLKAVAYKMAQEAAEMSGGGFSSGGGGGKAGQYTAGMLRSRADIFERFGPMSVGGYANRNIAGTNSRSAHSMWRAFDYMVGLGNVAKGNQIAGFLQQNAGQYGLKGLIWNAMSNYGGGWKPYRHPGGGTNPTLMHRDHVHAEYYRHGGQVRRGAYDQGGWLQPGVTLAENWTGRPERISTPGQEVMPRIDVTATVNVYIGNTQLRDIVRQEVTVQNTKRDMAARAKAPA